MELLGLLLLLADRTVFLKVEEVGFIVFALLFVFWYFQICVIGLVRN